MLSHWMFHGHVKLSVCQHWADHLSPSNTVLTNVPISVRLSSPNQTPEHSSWTVSHRQSPSPVDSAPKPSLSYAHSPPTSLRLSQARIPLPLTRLLQQSPNWFPCLGSIHPSIYSFTYAFIHCFAFYQSICYIATSFKYISLSIYLSLYIYVYLFLHRYRLDIWPFLLITL